MSIRVRLTSGTESDLQAIYPYLDRHAEVGHADHVLDRLCPGFCSSSSGVPVDAI